MPDFLDAHTVDALAAVLGIGARHLTRLFLQHLGAPPSLLARTRRVQIAKKLLDETDLAITDTYGRPPSQVKRSRHSASLNGRTVTLQLAYRPPLHWSRLAALLAAEATPGVEAVRDGAYRRTIAMDQAAGWLCVRPVRGRHLLHLSLQLPDYAPLKHVMERVRTMCDLSANPEQIGRHLRCHPQLAPEIRRAPGLRLPGAWDGFEV